MTPEHVEQTDWEGALRYLHEDSFAYMATGPRRHEDWRLDVLAVMNRSVADPRGWAVLDEWVGSPGADEPAHPFQPPDLEKLGGRLYEIAPESAAQQLVAMTDDGCMLPKVLKDRPERLDGLMERARTVLARFGASPVCLTNVTEARDNRTPDYFSSSRGWTQMSVYSEDIGLVVLSEAEVGVFWTFADY
ncbi:hypothetical protein ACWFR1_38700 [Streptomyces sp. NPDC055103]|uniref:hypothetical protein n=1 Tax=unclassified Streptomyces TaxID=2593676 RepID=UPI002254DEF5|nr:hypothetical protein [Streptomyces sp. NBC_00094]MCX5391760.1 hypothetical protein [Streptomyces sp. NBC_00094]